MNEPVLQQSPIGALPFCWVIPKRRHERMMPCRRRTCEHAGVRCRRLHTLPRHRRGRARGRFRRHPAAGCRARGMGNGPVFATAMCRVDPRPSRLRQPPPREAPVDGAVGQGPRRGAAPVLQALICRSGGEECGGDERHHLLGTTRVRVRAGRCATAHPTWNRAALDRRLRPRWQPLRPGCARALDRTGDGHVG